MEEQKKSGQIGSGPSSQPLESTHELLRTQRWMSGNKIGGDLFCPYRVRHKMKQSRRGRTKVQVQTEQEGVFF